MSNFHKVWCSRPHAGGRVGSSSFMLQFDAPDSWKGRHLSGLRGDMTRPQKSREKEEKEKKKTADKIRKPAEHPTLILGLRRSRLSTCNYFKIRVFTNDGSINALSCGSEPPVESESQSKSRLCKLKTDPKPETSTRSRYSI